MVNWCDECGDECGCEILKDFFIVNVYVKNDTPLGDEGRYIIERRYCRTCYKKGELLGKYG